MSVSVRPYEPGDLEACRGLWRALTQHHRDIYDDQRIGGDDPGVHFDQFLDHPGFQRAWVAETGGQVVGLTGLLFRGGEAEVEPVVVDTGYRGKGIGRQLIERVVEEAKRRGLKSISIRPVARNADAIACFHAAGFKTLGHIEMMRDLRDRTRPWKQGINLHGKDCAY